MKALVYHGPNKVSVDTVDDPRIEKLTDVIVKLTTTNICGSDLHMYEGRTDVEKGKILGHENLGEVVEVGKAVDTVKKGDRVVLPFNIGCGFCANCERGLTGFCLTCADSSVMPGMAGAAYGFAGMGPYQGGQAQYLRVPYADFNCLQLRRRKGQRKRLRNALRHLPHGMAFDSTGKPQAGRIHRYLRSRAGRPHGCNVRPHPGCQPDLRSGWQDGSPRAGRGDRCHPHRHHEWRNWRSDPRADERDGR